MVGAGRCGRVRAAAVGHAGAGGARPHVEHELVAEQGRPQPDQQCVDRRTRQSPGRALAEPPRRSAGRSSRISLHLEPVLLDHPQQAAPGEEPDVGLVQDAALVVVEDARTAVRTRGYQWPKLGTEMMHPAARAEPLRRSRAAAASELRRCSSTSAAMATSNPSPTSSGIPFSRSACDELVHPLLDVRGSRTASTPVTWCPRSRSCSASRPPEQPTSSTRDGGRRPSSSRITAVRGALGLLEPVLVGRPAPARRG